MKKFKIKNIPKQIKKKINNKEEKPSSVQHANMPLEEKPSRVCAVYFICQ